MPSLDSLLLFAVASLLLALTPGPNLVYLLSRTLCQGREAGIVSLAGTSCGLVCHVLAAALGLSAVFITVPVLYDALRYVGAAYLLWLAWQTLRPGGTNMFAPQPLPADKPARLFRVGLLTSILNPKVAMFYLALFPQFVDARGDSIFVQALVLGVIQVSIGVATDLAFILTASRVSRWLAQRPMWTTVQRWVMGAVFTGIAVRLASDSER